MLILDRFEGESIYIGENMTVTLIQVNQNTARIGIKAPKNIPILREELAPYDETKKLKNKS